MDKLISIINYNNYCNDLYTSYINKHFEFIKFYFLITKLINVNKLLTKENPIIDLLSVVNNIDEPHLDFLIREKTKLNKNISKLEEKRWEYQIVDKLNSAQLDKLVNMDSDVEQVGLLEKNNIEKEELLERIKELELNKQALTKKIEELKATQENLDLCRKGANVNEQLGKENNKLLRKKSELEDKLVQLTNEKEGLEKNKKELTDKIENLSNLVNECNTESDSKLKEQKELLDNTQKELTALANSNKGVDDILNKEINDSKELEKEKELELFKKSLSDDLEEGNQDLSNKTIELNESQSQLDFLNDKISKLQHELELINGEKITVSAIPNPPKKKLALYKFDCNCREPLNPVDVDRIEKMLIAEIKKQLDGCEESKKFYIDTYFKYKKHLLNPEVGKIKKGHLWEDTNYTKAKALEWFCKYCKAGLIERLLTDSEAIHKARIVMNEYCKKENMQQRSCPEIGCTMKKNECVRDGYQTIIDGKGVRTSPVKDIQSLYEQLGIDESQAKQYDKMEKMPSVQKPSY